MTLYNPWDLLSVYFDTTQNEGDIPSGAADNIFIAWPVFLKFINKYIPLAENKKALDYGCGAGSFANKLYELGFKVTGIDSSSGMVQKAKKAYGKNISFSRGESTLLRSTGPFTLITSIMTLQFIEDVEETIADFANSLIKDGYLIFAVHNPNFIKGDILRFNDGLEVPIYIRTAEEYNAMAVKYKLQPLLEEYPSFTEEFIEKYPDYKDTKVAEYLILGFKKE